VTLDIIKAEMQTIWNCFNSARYRLKLELKLIKCAR